MIAACLESDPERRPTSEQLCGELNEAILKMLLPKGCQRQVWEMAIEIGTKEARTRDKGKKHQDGCRSPDDPNSVETSERMVCHIFRVEWCALEKALCKWYLGAHCARQQDFESDYYDTTRLCLYIAHHLLGKDSSFLSTIQFRARAADFLFPR